MYSPDVINAVNEKVLWGSYLELHIERRHRISQKTDQSQCNRLDKSV